MSFKLGYVSALVWLSLAVTTSTVTLLVVNRLAMSPIVAWSVAQHRGLGRWGLVGGPTCVRCS